LVARLRWLPLRRRLPVRRLWLRLARLRRLSLRRLWLLGMGPLPLVGTLRFKSRGRLKSPGQQRTRVLEQFGGSERQLKGSSELR
jgi:hypothetical protein